VCGGELQVNNATWMFGDVMCDAWVASDVMCCTASILNLTAICIDRCAAASTHGQSQLVKGRIGAARSQYFTVGRNISVPYRGDVWTLICTRISQAHKRSVHPRSQTTLFATCVGKDRFYAVR